MKAYFLNNRWGGQHWCAWEAFYLFGHNIGVKYDPEQIALLQEWARLSKSVGWWAPWDGICFVSDRPREVHFNSERRLHNEKGMSCRYSDGWGIYSINGVAVPAEWVEKKADLDAKTAVTWPNMEQRRIACEIVGWAKIIDDLGGEVIDEDGDPQIGTLISVRLPDLDTPSKFCRVKCGTGRDFAIGVPPHIKTAIEAQAWFYDIPLKDFIRPEVRA